MYLCKNMSKLNRKVDEEDGMDDSAYIGKATFKANQFTRESNISRGAEHAAHVSSLRKKNEELEKMGVELDRMLNQKKQVLRQCKAFTWMFKHTVQP